MKVQEICDQLRANKAAIGSFALQAGEFPETTLPDEVLTPDFLADNVLKINDILLNKGTGQEGTDRNNFSKEGELTAQLQVNAFLANYQRAAFNAKRRRCDRLASKYTRTIVNGADFGPLAGQLRDIGVKVDPDFVNYINPENNDE